MIHSFSSVQVWRKLCRLKLLQCSMKKLGGSPSTSRSRVSSTVQTRLRISVHTCMDSRGVHNSLNHGSYLGLPSLVGRSKKWTFAFLKDMLRKRLLGLAHKFLCKPRKEIMLKAVAQTLPTFCMGFLNYR